MEANNNNNNNNNTQIMDLSVIKTTKFARRFACLPSVKTTGAATTACACQTQSRIGHDAVA